MSEERRVHPDCRNALNPYHESAVNSALVSLLIPKHLPTIKIQFSTRKLYNAYKKRTENIEVDLDEYNKMKEADAEFCRKATSLQYGKAPKLSEEKVDKMVKELKVREEKHKSFSRRCHFHEENDIDSINDRDEHFNKKIERAFGKYTLEIKNNLERGTALPD